MGVMAMRMRSVALTVSMLVTVMIVSVIMVMSLARMAVRMPAMVV
jgi:hypothetical protein